MTGPIRGFVTFVGLATLACALTACDGPVGGNPTPVSPSGSASSSAPSTQSDTPLAGMSPCKTLDQALAGQGYPASTPSIADPEHGCSTDKTQDNLGLVLQDGQSYDTNLSNPSMAQPGHVRTRRAILELEPTRQAGLCAVRIEVKPNSRALVSAALTSGNTDEACTRARNVAEAVELLLPKNT
ncbi:hypothetical protein [Amycolatopsis sp. DSM 110486]|uniref:hypothetical protein n=1 Tax=Amycolatopsis sp. DSM 110486 TaxID=2865832 RepID=UPI001C695720|nr:hypothetical protein [Amycolatopsis sp. DSM 110486]QYN23374.1 hypothetical protein K1T34_13510 [Amycolatopsis sp. DSM 110486]